MSSNRDEDIEEEDEEEDEEEEEHEDEEKDDDTSSKGISTVYLTYSSQTYHQRIR